MTPKSNFAPIPAKPRKAHKPIAVPLQVAPDQATALVNVAAKPLAASGEQATSAAPDTGWAKILLDPTANAYTAMHFAPIGKETEFGIVEAVDAMIEKFQALDGKNGTKEIERMLLGQAVACQAIFGDMAARARSNVTTNLEAFDTYMRLGLRAQSQSRQALETLAEIKNPRPIFINPQQVNHSGGGPQQVNNRGARRKTKRPANKLLKPGQRVKG